MKISPEFVPEALQSFFAEHPRVALAFSGGCDSAYLLYAAAACRAEILVCCVKSCFQPAFELEDARLLAGQMGEDIHILNVDVLADEDVRSNPANRCYHCKRNIFSAILACAAENGFNCVIDGTNASDNAQDRPGMRALREMQVLSPLRICGISKAEVRRLSKEAGIFTWNKPAYACLATRIPAGTAIEEEMLAKVERGEGRLAEMGFSDFRLRMCGGGARLEITEKQMDLLMEKREQIIAALEGDFHEISLNLRLRKGLEQ